MATIGTERGQWSSRTGFILAAAGSAIGLGNICRFPYIAGQNRGGAFVLLYVLFVAIIGLPYMFAELSLGRATQKNPVGAIDAIKQGSGWRAVGLLGVLTGVGILSFYGVIAGWTFGYIFKMAAGKTAGFTEFIANPWLVLGLFAFFMLLTASIVYGGIQGGIERWSKILMPLLFVLLLALIIYANTLFWTKFGVLPARLTGDPDFLSHMSFVFGDFSLAFGALLMSIFVGWVWGANKAADEIAYGSDFFVKTRGFWTFMIKFFIPLVIFVILLNLFGLFD